MGLFRKDVDPIQMVGQILTFIEVDKEEHKVLFQSSNGKDYWLEPNGGVLCHIVGDMADLIDAPLKHASVVTFECPQLDTYGTPARIFKLRLESEHGSSEFYIVDSDGVRLQEC